MIHPVFIEAPPPTNTRNLENSTLHINFNDSCHKVTLKLKHPLNLNPSPFTQTYRVSKKKFKRVSRHKSIHSIHEHGSEKLKCQQYFLIWSYDSKGIMYFESQIHVERCCWHFCLSKPWSGTLHSANNYTWKPCILAAQLASIIIHTRKKGKLL